MRDPGRSATGNFTEEFARATIEGFFPEPETQLALEQRGAEQQLTLKRHSLNRTLGTVTDLGTVDTPGGPLNRTTANATAANEELISGLTQRLSGEIPTGNDETFAHVWEVEVG